MTTITFIHVRVPILIRIPIIFSLFSNYFILFLCLFFFSFSLFFLLQMSPTLFSFSPIFFLSNFSHFSFISHSHVYIFASRQNITTVSHTHTGQGRPILVIKFTLAIKKLNWTYQLYYRSVLSDNFAKLPGFKADRGSQSMCVWMFQTISNASPWYITLTFMKLS